MNDRGMKKWAPYKSLNEQETFLNQMREKRSRIEKPIISQDLAEQINYLLLNHNNKELLSEVIPDISEAEESVSLISIKILYECCGLRI